MTFLGRENLLRDRLISIILLIIHTEIFGEEDNYVLEFNVTFCIHAVFCHG